MGDSVTIECVCTAEAFQLRLTPAFLDEPPEISLTTLVSTWYSRQDSIVDKLWRRVKIFWTLVRGKEFRLEELMIDDPDEVIKLRDFLNRSLAEMRPANEAGI